MEYLQPRFFIENFLLILVEYRNTKHSCHPLHTETNLHVQIKIAAHPLSIASYSTYIRLRSIRSITKQPILFQIERSRSHHTRPHQNSTTLHHKLERPHFKTNDVLFSDNRRSFRAMHKSSDKGLHLISTRIKLQRSLPHTTYLWALTIQYAQQIQLKFVEFGRELDSESNTNGSTLNTSRWANRACKYSMDFGKPSYFERNSLFFIDDVLQVRCHSIDNSILNLTQAIPDSTQVVERIAPANTPWTWGKASDLERNTLFFTDDLLQVRCHSIDNSILNLTQPISDSTQVVERIAPGNTILLLHFLMKKQLFREKLQFFFDHSL